MKSSRGESSGGYRLDRIGLRELTAGYFGHSAVITYLVLLPPSVVAAFVLGDVSWSERLASIGFAALLTVLLYPLAWYLLHRYVLHGTYLYKSPRTAALWKRIHFDHHQDPNDLDVLFGAPLSTLPTIAILLLPLGYLVGGPIGVAGAFATSLIVTLFYEYCHCIQHLAYTPKSKFMRRIKRLHLLHHFHNESGNLGITNYLWDRIFGTFYAGAGEVPRSPDVSDLGYKGEERERYPWVAQLTEGLATDEAG
jgi:sterol desaturase/sphingolipid hydroxylase (fatty acid hydroxylase superfamily)